MRVLVISGFLGAGKTTFIQELARRTGRDFVVYENEYGQADIDAQVLSQTDELSVWESTENCICCTGRQDFASSVLTIANTLDPEYLVVEPTGVARLSSVVDNVSQVSYERISLLQPLVIVDVLAWARQRERFEDIYLDQVASAAVVVLSKVQHAGAGELDAVRAWVAEKNPGARVVDVPYDRLDDAFFSSLLENDLDSEGASAPVAQGAPVDDDFESLSLAGIDLPSESHLLWFLDALVAGVFGEVVRAKGTLPCGGQWLRFDVVDRAWSVTGAEEGASRGPGESIGVFIGPEVRRPWLRETLLPVVRDAVAAGRAEVALDEANDYRGRPHHEHGCGSEHHHHGRDRSHSHNHGCGHVS